MSAPAETPSEGAHEASLLNRVKGYVGLSPAPKEHKLDIGEHETDVSPHYKEPTERVAPATPQAKPAAGPGPEETLEAPPPTGTRVSGSLQSHKVEVRL
jgi:hypothetical protein